MSVSEVISAKIVFPVDRPPLQDGAVWVQAGQVKAVGPSAEVTRAAGPDIPCRRLAGCAIVPGFVNAHTHLELTDMDGCIPSPAETGEDFTSWIRQVLSIREHWDMRALEASVTRGIRMLLESGATTIGDVTASGCSLNPLAGSALRAVIFREVLGFGDARLYAAREILRDWMGRSGETVRVSGDRVQLAVSPHAPHSTSPDIYRLCADVSRAAGRLLGTHVSETREELEFVASGTGAFRDLLAMRGISIDEWTPPGTSPVRYLAELGIFSSPGLAVHVNYMAPGDLDILAKGQLIPVYCPRSHAFFGHANHPAGQILQSGIPLAIGTDSLASNTGLDMLGELKLARRLHAQVSASTWLRCATLTGATALRVADTIGSLTIGKAADLCVIRLGSHTDSAPDLADWLLASDSTAIATMIAGKWVYTTAGGDGPATETC